MKAGFALVLISLAAMPGLALAQNGEPSRTPSPPPLPRSPQNPIGPPPPTAAPGPTTGPAGKLKPRPGGDRVSGLVGYLDSQIESGPKDIDEPVTGYGNEALWDAGAPQGDAASAGPPGESEDSNATRSTAGHPKR